LEIAMSWEWYFLGFVAAYLILMYVVVGAT
jgi:hypothetical protein